MIFVKIIIILNLISEELVKNAVLVKIVITAGTDTTTMIILDPFWEFSGKSEHSPSVDHLWDQIHANIMKISDNVPIIKVMVSRNQRGINHVLFINLFLN